MNKQIFNFRNNFKTPLFISPQTPKQMKTRNFPDAILDILVSAFGFGTDEPEITFDYITGNHAPDKIIEPSQTVKS